MFPQLRQARRRLILEQFGQRLVVTLLVTLLAAAGAIGYAKWRPIPWSGDLWAASWLAGAVAIALAAAGMWTYFQRRSPLDAALEIDRRFELKERISSTLALSDHERDTPIGAALASDAAARVARLDVPTRFQLAPTRRALAPLVPAAVALGLTFLPDAVSPETAHAGQQPQPAARKQIEAASTRLQNKLAEKREQAEKEKLKEAAELFQKVEQGVADAKKLEQTDRKQAVAKLNDLAAEIKQRRQQLADAARLRPQLQELKQIQKGPAERLADALKNGQLPQALKELEKLQDQLGNQQLNDEQKKQLAEQLQQMRDKLQQAADAQQQAKNKLEQQLGAAEKAGDGAKAQQLQQQLDKLSRQDFDMQQLEKLANQLKQAAQSAKEGDTAGAQRQLSQLAEQLKNMQTQMAESELLEQALDEIAKAKNSMNCEGCEGGG